jgi:hypothetical protein
MNRTSTGLFILCISWASMTCLQAGTIRLICPYAGTITDAYRNDGRNLDLEDTGFLKGLFVQWVDPERYQWNAFVYQSSDVNFSTLWGGHFIYDRYFRAGGRGKWVAGGGAEVLRIDMNAGSRIAPAGLPALSGFTLLNNLFIPYGRFGFRFQFRPKPLVVAVMPWVGAQYQGVRGNLDFAVDPPGPAPLVKVSENIDQDDFFGLAGLNLNSHLFHLIEIEGKVYGAFNGDTDYMSVSAMANLSLTRRCALSYRFKYLELPKGTDLYHLWGLAVLI